MSDAHVSVHALRVTARAGGAGGVERPILHDVSLEVARGRTLGVVGESGSGKTMLVRALTGLLPAGVTATGTYELDGDRVDLGGSERAWSRLRGRRVVLVLQDPFTSLDPMQRCGRQILAGRRGVPRAQRAAEVARRLAEVGLPAHVARQYPHELSGGMRQRVALAAALASDPELLVADEPTTALDVTTQREILDLLARIQAARGMTVVLITHDLALARERCDDVAVVRAGEIVERGTARAVFDDPQHPYTRQLQEAAAGRDRTSGRAHDGALLEVDGLVKQFPGAAVRAVDDVSLTVAPGECVGVVGESGSGKTTVARIVVGLETADAGTVTFAPVPGGAAAPASSPSRPPTDRHHAPSDGAGRRSVTPGRRDPRDVQIVFQDPYSALNPALSVGAMLSEALAVGPGSRTVDELLTMVGLPTSYARRRPARLSGGERQRVAIARALAPEPRLLVCDESVSALDVSVQAQILDLLDALRRDLGLTILFISHDLGVMQQVTDRVYVMRAGRVVEHGPTSRVLAEPDHPYTQALLAAVPSPAPSPVASPVPDADAGPDRGALPDATADDG